MILQALDELIEFVDADEEMSDGTKTHCGSLISTQPGLSISYISFVVDGWVTVAVDWVLLIMSIFSIHHLTAMTILT